MNQTNSKIISLTINKEHFNNINVENRQNLGDFSGSKVSKELI